MNFTTTEFNRFREDVSKALASVEKQYDVKIDTGKIKYSSYEFNLTLKVEKADLDVDVQQRNFEEVCAFYGFTKEDYKKKLVLQGQTFELVGFNPRAPKNCCSIFCIDNNKLYKTSLTTVKNALHK